MSMHCPECGTEDVHRVAVAYEKGVQNTRSKTIMGGGIISLFGPALGVGVAATRGRNSTLLAERIAPPRRARPILSSAVTFVIMIIVYLLGYVLTGWLFGLLVATIVGIILLAIWLTLPFYVLYKGFVYNHRFPKLMESWNNLYLCDRCGEVFPKDIGLRPTATPQEDRSASI